MVFKMLIQSENSKSNQRKYIAGSNPAAFKIINVMELLNY